DAEIGPGRRVAGVAPDDLTKRRGRALVLATEEVVNGDIEALGHTRYPVGETREERKSLPSQLHGPRPPSSERRRRTGAALYSRPGVSRPRNPRAQPESSVPPVLFLKTSVRKSRVVPRLLKKTRNAKEGDPRW